MAAAAAEGAASAGGWGNLVPATDEKPWNSATTPLLTDMYQVRGAGGSCGVVGCMKFPHSPQVSMSYAYWLNGRADDPSVFDMFFRKNPFKGEFTVLAGIEEVRGCCRWPPGLVVHLQPPSHTPVLGPHPNLQAVRGRHFLPTVRAVQPGGAPRPSSDPHPSPGCTGASCLKPSPGSSSTWLGWMRPV